MDDVKIKASPTALITAISNMVNSAISFINNTPNRNRQQCIAHTDKMIERLERIKPALLTIRVNESAKDDIKDIYTYIRKYKKFRINC